MIFKTGLGEDSHKFADNGKPLILAGVHFESEIGFEANSDGDVVLHALTNAISSITTKNILGKVADEMCERGITDSAKYLEIALLDLQNSNFSISHIAISIECLRPKINPNTEAMRANIATLTGTSESDVGITATTGEGLSDYGKGLGVFVSVIVSAFKA